MYKTILRTRRIKDLINTAYDTVQSLFIWLYDLGSFIDHNSTIIFNGNFKFTTIQTAIQCCDSKAWYKSSPGLPDAATTTNLHEQWRGYWMQHQQQTYTSHKQRRGYCTKKQYRRTRTGSNNSSSSNNKLV